MPIYEYQCEQCAHQLEAMQSISAPPLTDCPACGTANLKKRISAAGFRLKGSGWYVTDFRDNKKPAGKTETSKSSDASGATSTDASAASPSGGGGDTNTGSTTTAASTSTTTPSTPKGD